MGTESFDLQWIRSEKVIRLASLALATLHHGMSNLAPEVIPARSDTIITTANMFSAYLRDGTLPPPPPTNGRQRR